MTPATAERIRYELLADNEPALHQCCKQLITEGYEERGIYARLVTAHQTGNEQQFKLAKRQLYTLAVATKRNKKR